MCAKHKEVGERERERRGKGATYCWSFVSSRFNFQYVSNKLVYLVVIAQKTELKIISTVVMNIY